MWALFIVSIFLSFFIFCLTGIIGKFTGNKRATFPFGLAGQINQTVYSPECAPDDFRLIDPDHLTTVQVNLLLNHWLDRQRRKLAPFIILSATPQHETAMTKSEKAKGKRAMRYDPVSSGDEDGDSDASKNSEDDEDGGEEEVIPPPRFGPPTRKQPPSNIQEDATPAAGPSSTSIEQGSKKTKPPKPTVKVVVGFEKEVGFLYLSDPESS